jgi:hypothetical protein
MRVTLSPGGLPCYYPRIASPMLTDLVVDIDRRAGISPVV